MNIWDFPEATLVANGLIELIIIGAFGFYIIFSFVMVKQVNRMTATLEVNLEGFIRAIAYLHLLASIGSLIAALIVL